MPLRRYMSGNTAVYYKTMAGSLNGRKVHYGIAFRTSDAPIGYLPFYDVNDFDCSGSTSFKEQVLARMPMSLSMAGSPHTRLIQLAHEDPEFADGSEDGALENITRAVGLDRTRRALAAAGSVFIDGVMLTLGGPTIRQIVAQLVRSSPLQFLVSKSIGATAKRLLKEEGRVDVDMLRTAL